MVLVSFMCFDTNVSVWVDRTQKQIRWLSFFFSFRALSAYSSIATFITMLFWFSYFLHPGGCECLCVCVRVFCCRFISVINSTHNLHYSCQLKAIASFHSISCNLYGKMIGDFCYSVDNYTPSRFIFNITTFLCAIFLPTTAVFRFITIQKAYAKNLYIYANKINELYTNSLCKRRFSLIISSYDCRLLFLNIAKIFFLF